MFVFWKIWYALFSCNTCFDISLTTNKKDLQPCCARKCVPIAVIVWLLQKVKTKFSITATKSTSRTSVSLTQN